MCKYCNLNYLPLSVVQISSFLLKVLHPPSSHTSQYMASQPRQVMNARPQKVNKSFIHFPSLQLTVIVFKVLHSPFC